MPDGFSPPNPAQQKPDRIRASAWPPSRSDGTPRPKTALAKIPIAGIRADAVEAAHPFADQLSAHAKAVAKILDDLDVLLTFCDFPIEHHRHLRTTSIIESTFRDRAAAAEDHQGSRLP